MAVVRKQVFAEYNNIDLTDQELEILSKSEILD